MDSDFDRDEGDSEDGGEAEPDKEPKRFVLCPTDVISCAIRICIACESQALCDRHKFGIGRMHSTWDGVAMGVLKGGSDVSFVGISTGVHFS